MKNLIALTLSLALLVCVLASCSSNKPSTSDPDTSKPETQQKLAVITGTGGLGDQNLNDYVYAGAQLQEKEGVKVDVVQPKDVADFPSLQTLYAEDGTWLPLENKLPMHCSANVGKNGDSALFFGLSGTGKTTLSTDPLRKLIGDDEHGWDDEGIFNFEGGCYAKCINLDPSSEPEIYAAIRKDALLENVVYDESGKVDYSDASKTENTRVSYPIFHIYNHESTLKAGHPKNIIFLTADAFGVLPPVSKLTSEQAMYYFLSGYTAKVAGTERGITKPTATFSACFGEAFLPLHPTVYAKLLGEKIEKHNVNVYLVNTGWTGGPHGIGKRMSIKNTRACINSILDGSIEGVEFENFPIFNIAIPKTLDGVDTEILNPRNTWEVAEKYDAVRVELAKMFIENFNKYIVKNSENDYSSAGPKIVHVEAQ